jgi:predicted ribonuclease YlaK
VARQDAASVVVVPLRVVQELDAHKRSPSSTLCTRSSDTLRRLVKVLDGTLVGDVVDGVILRVFVDRELYDPHADEEIVNAASRVQTYAGRPVTMLTGDLSMQLRARAIGLESAAMPESLELPPIERDK